MGLQSVKGTFASIQRGNASKRDLMIIHTVFFWLKEDTSALAVIS
jgi:hypothetical protein